MVQIVYIFILAHQINMHIDVSYSFLYMGLFQAFQKAWNAACSSNGAHVLLVPQKNYLVKPITFSGPCKSQLTMQVMKN